MSSLAELKELRERADVNQEEAAAWIGVVRSTYTRKELDDLPTTIPEYELVKLKLELKLKEKEVVPSTLTTMIERIKVLCADPASPGSQIMEAAVKIVEGQEMLNRIMDKLICIESRLDSNSEKYDAKLEKIENAIKTDAADQKTGIGGL